MTIFNDAGLREVKRNLDILNGLAPSGRRFDEHGKEIPKAPEPDPQSDEAKAVDWLHAHIKVVIEAIIVAPNYPLEFALPDNMWGDIAPKYGSPLWKYQPRRDRRHDEAAANTGSSLYLDRLGAIYKCPRKMEKAPSGSPFSFVVQNDLTYRPRLLEAIRAGI